VQAAVECKDVAVRIMLFLHGTAIMHRAAVGVPQAERVRQSARRDPSVTDFGSYLPSEGAVGKAATWQQRGADICYLSSHRVASDVDLDRTVLHLHGFPAGRVFFRAPGETTPTWLAAPGRTYWWKMTARASAAPHTRRLGCSPG
jgi:hypothetical protein